MAKTKKVKGSPKAGDAESQTGQTRYEADQKWVERAQQCRKDWEEKFHVKQGEQYFLCLLYTSPSPRDYAASRMPSSA